jgi:hypothetical protein
MWWLGEDATFVFLELFFDVPRHQNVERSRVVIPVEFDPAVCENILCGYLYDGDLVFVILKGIYGFKFPKRFLEISSRDLTSSFLFCQS